MKYALISNSIVENIIEADEDFIQIISSDWDHIEALDTLHEQGLGVGIGWSWNIEDDFLPPSVPPAPPATPPVYEWYIDVGPFFDRFGTSKTAVLTSTDVGVQALVKDASVRHWIDLKRTDLPTGLAYIGSVIPGVNSTLRDQILNTPVSPSEQLCLVKKYFSG